MASMTKAEEDMEAGVALVSVRDRSPSPSLGGPAGAEGAAPSQSQARSSARSPGAGSGAGTGADTGTGAGTGAGDAQKQADLASASRGSDEKRFWTCARRADLGANILVFGKAGRTFPLACMLGPDWCCSVFTIILISLPSGFALAAATSEFSRPYSLLGWASFVTCMGSFCMTSFSDPGIIRKQSRRELELSTADGVPREGRLCDRCNVYQPSQARHCFDCDVCVLEMDHCPWTGRCIGKRNIRTFYIFLFSLLFHIIYVIIALNVHVANHNGDRARLRHQGQSHHRVQVRP